MISPWFTHLPSLMVGWGMMWRWNSAHPVCSLPSPSRSGTRIPCSTLVTSPVADATAQESVGPQPPATLLGAKSMAAWAPSTDQAPCGPPVYTQETPRWKGRIISGCCRPGGRSGSTKAARSSGLLYMILCKASIPFSGSMAANQSCWL